MRFLHLISQKRGIAAADAAVCMILNSINHRFQVLIVSFITFYLTVQNPGEPDLIKIISI